MAEKLKPNAKGYAAKMRGVAGAIKRVNEAKEKGAEYNGSAGKATKDFCDSENVNKTAFTFIATCHRKESIEAMDRVLSVMALALGSGLLDQIDMFDDRVAFIRSELDKRLAGDAAPVPANGSATIAALSAAH